jgi:2-deoxy-D-gluconate 3-dehydrogenase
MNLFDLSGRVALVTGGNGGIGFAMARGMATAGARIVIAARNADKNKQAVLALRELQIEAESIEVDLSDPEATRAAVTSAEKMFGRLDILVANAGTNIRKPPQDYALAEWQSILDINLTSAFVAAQSVYPIMKRGGGGKIITTGSMMTLFGAPFAAAYAASKGGLGQLTKALATSWAVDNIQVNCVLPGWIDTELTVGARAQVPGLNEHVLQRTAAGRWGKPDDFDGIAVFLASRASDYVTGALIPVDGGYSAQS